VRDGVAGGTSGERQEMRGTAQCWISTTSRFIVHYQNVDVTGSTRQQIGVLIGDAPLAAYRREAEKRLRLTVTSA
jgi:hypothetical protein